MRRRHDFGSLLGVGGHRLLDHHVLACFERVDGDRRVQVVRQGDGDGVDVGLLEKFPIVRVAARDVKALGSFPQTLRIRLSDRDRRSPGTKQQTAQVFDSDRTGTDNRAAEFLAHT